MTKIKKTVLMIGSVFVVSGCMNLSNPKQQAPTMVTEGVTTTVASSGDYHIVFLDGKYPTSQTRGATLSLGTSTNIAEFERGLMSLSKQYFPVEQYYFLEGRFLTSEEVNSWLKNKSADNPDGLNDAVAGENPLVMSILEQDYTAYIDDSYTLSGMSIGLALNPIISNTKTLTDDELLEKGKEAANRLVTILRTKEGFEGLPIMVGLFKQNVDNGVSRGAYLQKGYTTGATIGNWEGINVTKRVFPLDTDRTDDVTVFNGFKQKVESFFPNLTGIVGEATFNGDMMTSLNITITTQFYGQAEMIALSQFLAEQAVVYNKTGLSVIINVQSVRGSEIILFKKTDSETFQSVVLH